MLHLLVKWTLEEVYCAATCVGDASADRSNGIDSSPYVRYKSVGGHITQPGPNPCSNNTTTGGEQSSADCAASEVPPGP
jgi:hypothetical protein